MSADPTPLYPYDPNDYDPLQVGSIGDGARAVEAEARSLERDTLSYSRSMAPANPGGSSVGGNIDPAVNALIVRAQSLASLCDSLYQRAANAAQMAPTFLDFRDRARSLADDIRSQLTNPTPPPTPVPNPTPDDD